MRHKESPDKEFINKLRDNRSAILISFGGSRFVIPRPDKRVSFEFSVALQAFLRREMDRNEQG